MSLTPAHVDDSSFIVLIIAQVIVVIQIVSCDAMQPCGVFH